MVTAACEVAGINFTRLQKFAKLLNLQFILSTIYYEHRGNFVFPEINHAWEKEQQQQVDEIVASERKLVLTFDGQCETQCDIQYSNSNGLRHQ